MLERLPATLELAFAALLLAIVVALPLGIVAALYRGRAVDMLAMGFAVVGQATPHFWMGIMLILVVSVELGWLPTSGRGGWQHLILPAVTLGTHFGASLARLTRASILEVLGQNFVTTARAKGLGEPRVVLAHALKNAAVLVVMLIGLQLGALLGGAVVTLDAKKRRELYAEATRIVHVDKPWLEMFQEVVIYGVGKRLAFRPRVDYRLLAAGMTLAR